MKKQKKKRDSEKSSQGDIKDHYTVVCYYNDDTCYTHLFYGTGEQLEKFALKVRKEKDEGKLPKRVSVELIG
jgi:hypothetical protein